MSTLQIKNKEIEIRSAGTYAILPASEHPAGDKYPRCNPALSQRIDILRAAIDNAQAAGLTDHANALAGSLEFLERGIPLCD